MRTNKTLRLDQELNKKLKIKLIEDDHFKSFQEAGEWFIEKYISGDLDEIIDQSKGN